MEYQRRRRSIDIMPGEEQDPASLYIDLEQQPFLKRVKRDEYQDHKAPFVHINFWEQLFYIKNVLCEY